MSLRLRGAEGRSVRNGGVRVLRPAVGRYLPEEPPTSDYAASRRPGKSALFALASGVGGQGGRAARLRGSPRRWHGPDALRRSEAAGQGCELALGQLGSAPSPVLWRPGPASWLSASLAGACRSAPRGDWGRPRGDQRFQAPFWEGGCPSSVL